MAKNDYSNMRDVLLQALACESSEVFIRALMGYASDDYFWDNAALEDLELVGSLLDLLVSAIKTSISNNDVWLRAVNNG